MHHTSIKPSCHLDEKKKKKKGLKAAVFQSSSPIINDAVRVNTNV
jgi:hypothetical protein